MHSTSSTFRRFIIIFIAFSTLVCSAPLASSADITSLCWITEAWPKFTQEDGDGVYHDLIQAIFATQNVTVNVEYAPWKRAVENVKKGVCDMTGGLEPDDDFHQAHYPIFEYRDLVVFKKGTMAWRGLQSLEGKTGVWVKGYIDKESERPVMTYAQGYAIETYERALTFLEMGRADYMLCEIQALLNYSQQVEVMDLSQYEWIEFEVGQFFMSFTKNERGQQLRDVYDRGVEALTTDAIEKIYAKWGLTAPEPDM